MADTFTWLPDDSPNGQFSFRINSVQFGDGYKQIAKDGLNSRLQKWPLSFNRDQSITGAIQNFLDDNEGEWFWWTPPGSNAAAGKYICLGYTKNPYKGTNEKIDATFEEFVAP